MRGQYETDRRWDQLTVVARSDEGSREVVRATLESEPARRLDFAYLVQVRNAQTRRDANARELVIGRLAQIQPPSVGEIGARIYEEHRP